MARKRTQKCRRSAKPEDPLRLTVVETLARLRRNLKDKISAQGFSQQQVAARLGWAYSTLSKVLCGRVALRVEHVLSICAAIGIQLADLLVDLPEQPVAKEDLLRLLHARDHPARVLGPVDAEALKAAVQCWQPRTGPERAYLAKVLQWCECSLETDRRAARRRAAGRRRVIFRETLNWPEFNGD